MSTEQIETVDHRRRPGRPGHRLPPAAARPPVPGPRRQPAVGDNWRAQWDTLRLYSPAGYDGLPGLPFPGPRWSYPTKDDVADYLAAYADQFALPVRTGVRVDRLEATDGGYALRIGTDTVLAENVVVATGHLRPYPEHPRLRAGARPRDPPAALQRVPPARPATARAGPRRRRLALRHRHRLRGGAHATRRCWPAGTPGSCRSGWITGAPGCSGRRSCSWPRTCSPAGRRSAARRWPEVRFHGGPMIRVKRADLAARGVERVLGRVTGVRNGRPVLEDRELDVTTVIWCTGFRQVFDWIDLPILGADGWPRETRGVVAGRARSVLLRAVLPVRVQLDGAAPGSAATRTTSRGRSASGRPGRWRSPGEPSGVPSAGRVRR